MHIMECIVDLPKSHIVSYVLINLNFLQSKGGEKYVEPQLNLWNIAKLKTDYIEFTFFMYLSTSQGTCERLLKPPKAVPFHTRPVTNWKGRVDIS